MSEALTLKNVVVKISFERTYLSSNGPAVIGSRVEVREFNARDATPESIAKWIGETLKMSKGGTQK